ncbi:MAG: hypothetical protein P1V35_03770 [Planctomycetota bacterium]|nr:hypothetical protein [Planctomycetota bacterium]
MTESNTALRYDQHTANRMIPLLDVLVTEFLDRTNSVRSLRRQIAKLVGPDGRLPETQPERSEGSELQAQLSTQLRECRLVTEELENLACEFDARRRMVRITGQSGEFEDGFEWYLGSSEVVSVKAANFAGA